MQQIQDTVHDVRAAFFVQMAHQPLIQQAQRWIYDNPTYVKVMEVAAVIFGASLVAASIVCGAGLAVCITLGVSGALIFTAATVAFMGLDLLVAPHHDMKIHVYEPSSCRGGKLHYEGDVPILTLESDDPEIAGRAQGYLCGRAIEKLVERYRFVIHTVAGKPRAAHLQETMAALRKKIPEQYLKEIDGVVAGYKQWAKENKCGFAMDLSSDDIILLHTLPDSAHLSASHGGMGGTGGAIGCTALVGRNESDDIVFARNLDWFSLGLAGSYSLVVNRRYTNGSRNTVEASVPGFVGVLTGMNDQGLCLSMNICDGKTDDIRGMPAVFYNRQCLDTCSTVADVKKQVEKEAPLGPYNMTIADKDDGASIHFYQAKENTYGSIHEHAVRTLPIDKPLSVFNSCYDPKPQADVHYCSAERRQEFRNFIRNHPSAPLEDALGLPLINNASSIHKVVMEPKARRFDVAFDNAFAGEARLHIVSAQTLLSR